MPYLFLCLIIIFSFAAAQIAQTKKGCINIETPDSILVNTNLRVSMTQSLWFYLFAKRF